MNDGMCEHAVDTSVRLNIDVLGAKVMWVMSAYLSVCM